MVIMKIVEGGLSILLLEIPAYIYYAELPIARLCFMRRHQVASNELVIY